MSRYVIDHRGEAERSDRRPMFANESFEKKSGTDDGIVRGAEEVAVDAGKRKKRMRRFSQAKNLPSLRRGR